MAVESMTSRTQSIRSRVSMEEWETRVNLAACYRVMAHYEMADLIYNHVSARVPGTEHILINSYGMLYEEVTASSLFKIDLDANIILDPETGYGINYPGYMIHSAVHGARSDAECVIHVHTRATMAVSAMKCGLLPITQTALRFFERTSYHAYEGPTLKDEEKGRMIANLGRNDVMLLHNHGALALGRSIPDAFNIMFFLEMACRAQIDALSGNQEIHYPPRECAEMVSFASSPDPTNKHGVMNGMREWPAMLRLAKRLDPSFAD
jgi:ribulose-5-phosphate 4-epimerase/fuculose-1-phosphate aldolase